MIGTRYIAWGLMASTFWKCRHGRGKVLSPFADSQPEFMQRQSRWTGGTFLFTDGKLFFASFDIVEHD
ncbi:MAG: hypothetical protein AAF989_04945, partial [Planctomycetota bacterium]